MPRLETGCTPSLEALPSSTLSQIGRGVKEYLPTACLTALFTTIGVATSLNSDLISQRLNCKELLAAVPVIPQTLTNKYVIGCATLDFVNKLPWIFVGAHTVTGAALGSIYLRCKKNIQVDVAD